MSPGRCEKCGRVVPWERLRGITAALVMAIGLPGIFYFDAQPGALSVVCMFGCAVVFLAGFLLAVGPPHPFRDLDPGRPKRFGGPGE